MSNLEVRFVDKSDTYRESSATGAIGEGSCFAPSYDLLFR